MILYAMLFVLGYFTYPMVGEVSKLWPFGGNDKEPVINEKSKAYLDELEVLLSKKALNKEKTKQKEFHLKPNYYAYGGGYDLITKCQGCTMTALYEDQHPAKPCHFCGNEIKTDGAAKWMEIDGKLQWNKKLIK